MDLGLTGKKALVTGATKGIGRAVAETLLAEGASVAICARDAEGVEQAIAEMSLLGTVVGASVDAAVCVRAGAGALLGSGICCDAAACCCCCDADLLLCCCFRSPSTGGQRCATSPACRTRSTLHRTPWRRTN